jgi:hypothetical protein
MAATLRAIFGDDPGFLESTALERFERWSDVLDDPDAGAAMRALRYFHDRFQAELILDPDRPSRAPGKPADVGDSGGLCREAGADRRLPGGARRRAQGAVVMRGVRHPDLTQYFI